MFSDDNDDVINLEEDNETIIKARNDQISIDENKKKAFDNLFADDQTEVFNPNNKRVKLQMNKTKDTNDFNDSDKNNTKNTLNRKDDKPKNIFDELEDIVL